MPEHHLLWVQVRQDAVNEMSDTADPFLMIRLAPDLVLFNDFPCQPGEMAESVLSESNVFLRASCEASR